MKIQFKIFLLLIFAIPSFGQDLARNTSQEIKQLPHFKIKPVVSDLKEYETRNERRGCCYPINFIEPKLRTIGDCEEFGYCRSSCASAYSISFPKNADKEVKKRYTALTERHSSRYPNNKVLKTPELQSTLQEIRF